MERELFIKALAANEDDETTRLVFADWLEEQGEPEEAERQRQWKAAKRWLQKFVWAYEYGHLTYEELLHRARQAAAENDWHISLGRNEDLCYALRSRRAEFWRNVGIVLGIKIPLDIGDKSGFGCAC